MLDLRRRYTCRRIRIGGSVDKSEIRLRVNRLKKQLTEAALQRTSGEISIVEYKQFKRKIESRIRELKLNKEKPC